MSRGKNGSSILNSKQISEISSSNSSQIDEININFVEEVVEKFKWQWKLYKDIENGIECSKIKLKQNGKIISNNHEVANNVSILFKETIVNIKQLDQT